MDPRRPASRVLVPALGTAVLVAVAALSPRAVPYNMDEFVHYHALGCATAPLGQDLPSFRDGCGLYDLRLPLTGTWLPLRSYYYIGSLPAAVFFPFWLLLDDPVAARVQGALFLVAFVLLAARLLRVRPGLVLLAAVVFPVFALAFVVDTGPVGLSALLLLAALLSVRRSLGAGRLGEGVAWAGLAGVTLFLGLWVKLVFAWWLPAVALFALAEGWQHPAGGPGRRGRAVVVATGVLALLVPTLLLLASVDVEGQPYGAALSRGGVSLAPAHLAAGAGRLLPYLTDASRLAPRNVTLPPSVLDRLSLVLSALILGTPLLRGSPRRREIGGWLALAVLTFALASTSSFTQWPHHFVFPAIFLVLALARALDAAGRPLRLVTVSLVVVLGISLALRWPEATFPRPSSPEKDQLLAFVREKGLDRDMFQLHTSWGTYYMAQLFGDPKRMVVFVKGISDDPLQLREVACLARESRRPLLLISGRRWPRLQTGLVDETLGRPDRTWRFGTWWAVAYETEGVEGCPS